MSAKADLSLQASGDLPSSGVSLPPLRPISFSDPKVTVDRRADGTIYLRPQQALVDYPARLTDSLHRWASEAPDRVFMGNAITMVAGARSPMPIFSNRAVASPRAC